MLPTMALLFILFMNAIVMILKHNQFDLIVKATNASDNGILFIFFMEFTMMIMKSPVVVTKMSISEVPEVSLLIIGAPASSTA